MKRLRITEIFFSLQGETNLMGLPTVFVRLTGCPLRCQYCDTAYAFGGGSFMTLEAILTQVADYPTKRVTVSGGEPLAQPDCHELLTQLCDLNYLVSLETSGAISTAKVDTRVIKIIDIKTPGSTEVARNDFANLQHLQPHDQIKFVICDRSDYDWTRDIIETHHLFDREVLLSPSHTQLPAADLADWILEDGLNVRMQLQMQKYIWGDVQGK